MPPSIFADIDVLPQDAVRRMKFAPVALEGPWRLPDPLAPCFNARMTSNQPWWLTMPPVELAATILPFFSSPKPLYPRLLLVGIVLWLNTGSYPKTSDIPGKWLAVPNSVEFENPDFHAVVEAIQVLEHEGLILRGLLDENRLGLTRLGHHALQTNTVRQHLGLSDTPPPA